MSLSALLDRPIAYHRVFVNLGCGVTGAVLLSQCIYWSKRSKAAGWFYKTQEEWQEETGLTRSELEGARKKLMAIGVIEYERRGVPARGWYSLNLENLQTRLQETSNPDCRKPANRAAGNLQRNTETTTETTAETTSLTEAASATTVPDSDFVQPDDALAKIPADMPGPKDPNAKTFRVWANYAVTYRRRYGVYPVWNARVAGQLGKLIDRIGAEAAPKVAAYYLSIADQRYITEQHSVGMLLSRCEALHTQWQTGTRVNGTTARQQERTAANFEAAQTVIKKIMTDDQPVGSQQAEGSIYDNPFWK